MSFDVIIVTSMVPP